MRKDIMPVTIIERRIYLIRGKKVMLDNDLAELYEVPTERLNEQVKRNRTRFPQDFMFQLTKEEAGALRCQFGISSSEANLRSQIAISSSDRHGGRRYLPYVFTEQGVAMLSSVLRSNRAIKVNITIMRTFVHLRELLQSNRALAAKLEVLEKRYDSHFRVVFEVIRKLMKDENENEKREPMGFKITP